MALMIVQDSEQQELIDHGYCGAKTRNPAAKGPYCKHHAGKRTDHPGTGRCWLHGGMAGNLSHGRYSTVKREDLNDAQAEFEEDPAILDTGAEIAMVRALVIDFINRYEAFAPALLAWHRSFDADQPNDLMVSYVRNVVRRLTTMLGKEARGDEALDFLTNWLETWERASPKPKLILDIADATKMLSEITRMVERVQKSRNASAISRRDFARVMQQIGVLIDMHVQDDATKSRIRHAIGSMRMG